MNFEDKAKELYQQLFGHVDYRISQYVSEETVCSEIANALKEARELGLSEALKRVEELEAALTFYADEGNYDFDYTPEDGPYSNITQDGGERARAALTKNG